MATCSSVLEDAPTPKRPRVEKRQFLPAWKNEFPWVIYDRKSGMCYFCYMFVECFLIELLLTSKFGSNKIDLVANVAIIFF